MQVCPLRDRVLIRRADPEAVAAGGIFIPDIAQDKLAGGNIAAGRPVSATRLRAAPRSTAKELMIMNDADIMGVLDQIVIEKKAA